MNFLKKKVTKYAKKKVAEIMDGPTEQRNPKSEIQKLMNDAAGFLSKYTPGNIDVSEFIEDALGKINWVSQN